MKITSPVLFVWLLISISVLSACRPGNIASPTFTAAPTQPPPPTNTPEPPPTFTSPASTISMSCGDWAMVNRGEYQAQNNTWGKGSITDWSQCIGIEVDANGTLSGRWTWDWPALGSDVKAYPEVVFGQKPGSATTSPLLPRKINDLGELTVSYNVTSTRTGSGNLAFDFWLTDTANPDTWGVPPITHEIMIWLEAYGGMMPGGSFRELVNIDGSDYYVFVGNNWGDGWQYLAFNRVKPQLGSGSLNISYFTSYLLDEKLITGEEYLASVEFGNEVIHGVGETILKDYTVSTSP